MKNLYLLLLLVTITTQLFAQDTLRIQESEIGFCHVDGKIFPKDGSTSITGWTGTGFADPNNGIGVSISWQVFIPEDGTYKFVWRYAFSGTISNIRDAKLLVDGNVVKDTVIFPYTGTTWSMWAFTTPIEVYLSAGSRQIRLEALYTGGLGNFDYFMVIGNAPMAIVCSNPSYVVKVKSENPDWGTVSIEPLQNYYEKGSQVTIRAEANSGYFFESWTGEETSNNATHTFTVKANVNAVARFLPNGTTMDSDIIGYATVQDDKGTTYLVTGGALGVTVQANTLSDLQTYLGSSDPYVIKFSGELVGDMMIPVKSDKTLIGEGKAHLRGIGLSINQARNVIIRNITISHVTAITGKDAIEINGKSKNIVIDRCEFYSDKDNGTDYYDGLLDVKNESSFITVSWNAFYNHYKTSLISSGDTQTADTVIRITYHHNYFLNCESRLPSIRFGKAHIFNNYYKDCGDAINSRMDAWVRVERNYFENVRKAVHTDYSPIVGRVQLIDNHFGTSTYVTFPTCDLQVPYPYTIDPVQDVPSIVTNNVRLTSVNQTNLQPLDFKLHQNYPNPFNPTTTIKYDIPNVWTQYIVSLRVYDILGKEVATLVNEQQPAGSYEVTFSASQLASGIYFYKLQAGSFTAVKKLVLLR